MNFIKYLLVMMLLINSNLALSALLSTQNTDNINLLSFDDLVEIYRNKDYKKEVTDKVLNEPVVDNTINANENYCFKQYKTMGKYVRVAFWDISEGKNYTDIENTFLTPENLLNKIDVKNSKIVYIKGTSITKEEAERKVLHEAAFLKRSDIILLNEVQIGMPETDYKNMAEDLAKTLGYNYAFAPEFIELDHEILGADKDKVADEGTTPEEIETTIDKIKLKSLSGNAILSKFPIENARIIRLPAPYDWYKTEKENISSLESIKRSIAKGALNEETLPHVRLGSRCALLTDVKIGDDTLTLISVQLESRTSSIERNKQMLYLLSQIKDIKNPVLIAGNFNTTTRDNTPTSPKRVIKNTFTDVHNLARFGVGIIFPPGLVLNIARPTIDYFRKSSDPTVKSIPVIAPNYERKLFNSMKKFRFDDGYAFDFRGNDITSTTNFEPTSWLSNSNERGIVGFVPTYHINRNFGIANTKLDWIFVKAYRNDPFNENDSEKFAPHNAKTLHSLNFAYKEPISRHAPISVDFAIDDFTNFNNFR